MNNARVQGPLWLIPLMSMYLKEWRIMSAFLLPIMTLLRAISQESFSLTFHKDKADYVRDGVSEVNGDGIG